MYSSLLFRKSKDNFSGSEENVQLATPLFGSHFSLKDWQVRVLWIKKGEVKLLFKTWGKSAGNVP